MNGFLHTVEENIYKDWMNEKRTKKDFRIHKDDNGEYEYVFLTERMKRKWNY